MICQIHKTQNGSIIFWFVPRLFKCEFSHSLFYKKSRKTFNPSVYLTIITALACSLGEKRMHVIFRHLQNEKNTEENVNSWKHFERTTPQRCQIDTDRSIV